MVEISANIWVFDGKAVPFLTLPFTTRMTVIRLRENELWVHSPIELTSELKSHIHSLGTVKYLIAPNHLHHLFLKEWQEHYPDAASYGTAEVIKKRNDLNFAGELLTEGNYPWEPEVTQLLFTGSPLMEECVFMHNQSGSLIVTDLIENFPPSDFTPTQRLLARCTGILAPNGKMPIDWRMSFLFHKKEARKHYAKILGWKPERIILAHGNLINTGAMTFLHRSFGWLNYQSNER
ncbi:hypothetical protein DI392_16700 [Vibrio albus]|uniref:DUF4336 domain-containing protein n=1 Tax=Vibrio albus TaxID=2200953 RepID=A0A2U3B695_9VIBR|nr:DUF4336 domain-containing protein [Vibrio albus]PWI32310.1 hypothetical protein DI392_16700 [Vibrio albus]